ncbi:hypothetical protein A2Z00_00490 [Candidatus Gottesmanbacteria bacterium RBG_13_45_10]|uniref:Glycosyltransferase RgtA/B/C/D-like domain-containing protein n=1 Tax=Candidatus Gottesmanbacteria bacterium RBG_13_45_10 TaxID=1798370 RepID=A0A1F5ZGC1_9BACT|nr:MAG: hypothetical protein A2Z00_00490 [Candidatus Gottesmanbacteria bacterium RBG_13_45_10]
MLAFGFIITVLLAMVVKGNKAPNGSLAYQQSTEGNLTGPFESSGSNSRYALVEAIVKSKTFFFNNAQAGLAAPDLVLYNGKYFSIFTPGVAFAVLPFYLLGNLFGIPQLATYGATTLVAFVNLLLVVLIARKLGAGMIPSLISGFLFLFGTSALTYALTLTQHHLSILVILLATLTLFHKPGLLRNTLLGLLYGAGLLIDIPNAIILLPLMLYAAGQHLTRIDEGRVVTIKLKLVLVFLLLGFIPLLGTFGWYNKQVTGSYTILSQFLGRSDYPPKPKTTTVKKTRDPYAPTLPFYSRLQLNGLYILLISNERGWLYYSPIVFIGTAGLFLALKQKETQKAAVVILTMAGLTVTLYSTFGDPWGGWSFGPRYLLPATALLSTGIGLAIERWKRSILFGLAFLAIAGYGIYVSTFGAFTTTQVPPKQEAEHLVTFIPYTYEYNKQLIDQGKTGSLVYNLWLNGRIPLSSVVKIYQGIGISFTCIAYALLIRKEFFRKHSV